jgi:hypothetical protein
MNHLSLRNNQFEQFKFLENLLIHLEERTNYSSNYSGSQKLWAALKTALINWEIKIMKW